MSEHGYCDKCGKDLGDHPTVNVEGINTLALCQDRHPKWQRVEPGTVIPAGQPHAVSLGWSKNQGAGATWIEYLSRHPYTVQTSDRDEWFVDSSWKPPLVLPTEPTWGIAVTRTRWAVNEWRQGDRRPHLYAANGSLMHIDDVLDFIPLTDEQVQRIEAAR